MRRIVAMDDRACAGQRTGPLAMALFLCGASLGYSGCKASVSAKAGINATASQDVVSTEQPMEETGSRDMALPPAADVGGETALFGARHDLLLAAGTQGGKCKCLTVVVGPPEEQAFSWQSVPPTIDPRSQLIIGLSSDGVDCANEPEGSLGASYWGYRTAGGDVIVVIEAAKFGRPITNGAIVPKPSTGGRLMVKPLDGSVPYGAAQDGSPEGCVVFEG